MITFRLLPHLILLWVEVLGAVAGPPLRAADGLREEGSMTRGAESLDGRPHLASVSGPT